MLRAFKATFLVAVDDDECDDGSGMPANVEDMKMYLSDALNLSWNDEDFGNPCGVVSMEVGIEQLVELPPDEVKRLYQDKH